LISDDGWSIEKMLHVIFLILKIIGISLLIILGLILLIILTILFVPIRYRVIAEHGKDVLQVDARASWLLHLFGAKVTHVKGILHIQLRILWFTLFDNLRPKKPKEKRQRKKGSKVKKAKQRKSPDSKTNKVTTNADNNKQPKEALGQLTEIVPQKQNQETEAKSETVLLHKTNENLLKELKEPSSIDQEPDQGKKEPQIKKKPQSFIKKLIYKIKGFKDRLINFFREWKMKIAGWLTTASNIKDKISKICNFIKDELNKQGFKITYTSLKKILKHILPTKLKSRIVFGTGDPCSTGQALGAISILYSIYGDKIQIIPDFENEIFEGKHYARGRIRLVTILIIVIKLILDKRFIQLRKNIQILKEAL
jgi:hypothetical protein